MATTRTPDNIEPPLTRPVSTIPVSRKYFAGLFIAQFGLFIGLLTPVLLSMQLKVQELAPDNAVELLAAVLPLGALGALIANPLAGQLSDRTRSRWGRRRPWLVLGIVAFLGSLGIVATAGNQLMLTIGWVAAQVSANAVLAALVASFADNVPEFQRGKGSSIIAIAQNTAILAGTYLSVFLVESLPVLFLVPGALSVIGILIYAAVATDRVPTYTIPPLDAKALIGTFWTNPIKNPDFGLAWWSRFLITLASFMFTTFRLLYMQEHLGLTVQSATLAVANGVLIYTVALLVSAAVSGWLSDRLGRRKIFVGGSTALTAVGLIVLAQANELSHFYWAELILGFAYGIYTAVDNALIVDVLPNPERPGKDLGVINIANALPQSVASPFALIFLTMGVGPDTEYNYTVMLWAAGAVALIGALVILPIKKVR